MPGWLPFELFVLGRRIEAERAHALGVVTEIVAPDELEAAALATAGRGARAGTAAVPANARALRSLRGGADDAVRAELAATRRAGMRSAEFAEGVAAFRGRRAPDRS